MTQHDTSSLSHTVPYLPSVLITVPSPTRQRLIFRIIYFYTNQIIAHKLFKGLFAFLDGSSLFYFNFFKPGFFWTFIPFYKDWYDLNLAIHKNSFFCVKEFSLIILSFFRAMKD